MAYKNILFFGSDSVSLNVLRQLKQSKFGDPYIYKLKVVCPPLSHPKTPLAELHNFKKLKDIKTFFEFKNKTQWGDFRNKLKEEDFDIGVVASFGHMIPSDIVDHF